MRAGSLGCTGPHALGQTQAQALRGLWYSGAAVGLREQETQGVLQNMTQRWKPCHWMHIKPPTQKGLGWKLVPPLTLILSVTPDSECSPPVSSRSTTWELARNEEPQAPPDLLVNLKPYGSACAHIEGPSRLSPSNPNSQRQLLRIVCNAASRHVPPAHRNLSTHTQNFPKDKKYCTVRAYLHLGFLSLLNCSHLRNCLLVTIPS